MSASDISAQVGLYPLRPEHLDAVISEAIGLWQQRGLSVCPGVMSTVVAGEPQAVWDALRDAFALATERCEAVMVVTLSNACPVLAGPPPDPASSS